MATLNETAIYRQLTALLDGRLDFDDFWDWLRPLERTITTNDPARKLLFRIIAKLDEYDSSEMTDEQLRDYLTSFLPEQETASDQSDLFELPAGATTVLGRAFPMLRTSMNSPLIRVVA